MDFNYEPGNAHSRIARTAVPELLTSRLDSYCILSIFLFLKMNVRTLSKANLRVYRAVSCLTVQAYDTCLAHGTAPLRGVAAI